MKTKILTRRMMMAKSNNKTIRSRTRHGTALLMVLIIVMAITILSLGFLSKSSVQLECGQNMILHTQTDYLAQSALEYARQQILRPQDCPGEYWTGQAGLQIDQASSDFFDVNVVKTANCNYTINAEAYQLRSGQKTARSSLTAYLRLNPCIAYWQSKSYPIPPFSVINGDVYCGDNLTNNGWIYGDVYCAKTIVFHGYIQGRKFENVAVSPVEVSPLQIDDFKTQYYIGDVAYPVGRLAQATYSNLILEPNSTNPAGIYYRDGSLELNGAQITGMLVVKNNMKLSGPNEVTITAVKNFPALLVGDDLTFEDARVTLNVTGLVQINNKIDCKNEFDCKLGIDGALFILNEGLKNTSFCQIIISALPAKAAIQLWPAPGTAENWSPVGGTIFQCIKRN